MKWFTLLSYTDPFELVDSGAESRHINEEVRDIDYNQIMEGERKWLQDFHGRGVLGRFACWFDEKTGNLKLLIQNRINQIRKQAEIELRRKYALLNFDYWPGSSIFNSPHIDVYAENAEDAMKQLVSKKETIKGYFGVNVPDSIDKLVVMKGECPQLVGVVPPGYETSQKNMLKKWR